MARSHEMDMTEGPILKKIILFSLPLMLSSILQLLFNAADVIVVGRYAGSLSLAAVGACTSLINLLVKTSIGFSIGVNVLAAMCCGAHDNKRLSDCVHTAVLLGTIVGVGVGLLGIFVSTPLLRLMNTDPDVLPLSSLYLRIYFIGVPATILYNFCAAVLRAIGDTDRPLYFLLIAGVINVILNLITVICLHMDVAGVAIATVVSQYISLLLIVLCLLRSEGAYALCLKKLRISRDALVQILGHGVPAGLQSSLFNLSNMVIQSALNSFGAAAMAGGAAASNITQFVYATIESIYHAALSFVSQNVGARRFDRLKKVILSCLGLVVLTSGVLGFLAWRFGDTLLAVYVSKDDPNRAEVIRLGLIRLAFVCLPYWICGLMDVGSGILRGLGKSWTPMIVSIAGTVVFRVLWIYTVFQSHRTLQWLYASWPISWVLTGAVHYTIFFFAYRKLVRTKYRRI